LSTEFVDVIADMMAKDPAQRIPSAVEVIARLVPWAGKWGANSPSPLPNGSPQSSLAPLPPPATPSATPQRVTPPPLARPPRSIPHGGQAEAVRVGDTESMFPELPETTRDSDESSSLVLQTVDPLAGPQDLSYFCPPAAAADASEVHPGLTLILLLAGLLPVIVTGVALVIWWLLRTLE
jgi:hypothetical protein